MNGNDTVAAISTPYGRGGIAVIRISGDDAVKIASKVFFPLSGKNLEETPPFRAVYGKINGKKGQIDDGIATVFRAPRSFTGEDTVEISCHGGILLSNTVLAELFYNGARQADRGEFTKRAFVNGKMSLTEAEAVIDLIDAKTESGLTLARAQSNGVLSKKITEIADKMTDLLSEAYVTSDYPDEDLSNLSNDAFVKKTEEISALLSSLADTYKMGSAIREGIPTAIVGKPNTGKSSLLNALLGRDRAIVTNVPGTTRDTLEETVEAGRVSLLLTDTAGIRETDDPVEKIGVERSKSALENSRLVLAVFDGSEPLDDGDHALISSLEKLNVPVLPIINKCDEKDFSVPEMPEKFLKSVTVSAKNGDGIDGLKTVISSLFVDEKIDYNDTAIVTNARQYGAINASNDAVKNALSGLRSGLTRDMAALDIESAHSLLCETDGRETAKEITDKIFSRFCVGK